MHRLTIAAVLASALAMTACSDADLANFNAGLEAYNGYSYYDTTDESERLPCGSGNGYLVRHSGVRNNQQYIYFTSQTDIDVDVSVGDQGGGGTSLYVPARGRSEAHWTYPTFEMTYEWRC